VSRDVIRITRAVTTDEAGNSREFNLVEVRRSGVSSVMRAIGDDKSFQKRLISGLPVWERSSAAAEPPLQGSAAPGTGKPGFAIARVGPGTLAVGAPDAVGEAVLVRLGMKPDLKITGQLFDRFQALDRDSALRLISRDPPDLARVFHPIFSRELLEASQLLGLAVNLQDPVKARVLIKVSAPRSADDLARSLHDKPQQWLQLPDSPLSLYSQPPEVQRHGESNLELRFTIPADSARILLQRLAKTDTSAAMATY
jgi:hypothetical protein